jgi:hypothetical protein
MADKQTRALKRLTKKLSALRKTLRADERNLLDRMILGDEAAAEVQAHRITASAADMGRPTIILDSRTHNYLITGEEPEVKAHTLVPVLTPKIARQVTEKAKP